LSVRETHPLSIAAIRKLAMTVSNSGFGSRQIGDEEGSMRAEAATVRDQAAILATRAMGFTRAQPILRAVTVIWSIAGD
jgi:hypothetical protein